MPQQSLSDFVSAMTRGSVPAPHLWPPRSRSSRLSFAGWAEGVGAGGTPIRH
jgi:hypothetical protein